MTPSCSTCRFFTEVKRNGTVLKFSCLHYHRCRGGKVGAGLHEYSPYTTRARERKT